MYQKFMLSSWHNSLLYASEDSISSVSPVRSGVIVSIWVSPSF